MNDIEKYKKRVLYFRICGIILILLVFIYFLITIINANEFDLSVIVAIIIFSFVSVMVILFFFIFDRYRIVLVEKYYGKVNEFDISTAKRLLKYIDILKDVDYEFLEIGYLQEYDFNCRFLLEQLVKGHKINIKAIKSYLEVKSIINTLDRDEISRNQKYNNYLSELVALFERNKSEI